MVLRPFYSFFVLCLLLSTCNLGNAVKDLKDKHLTTEKEYDEAKEKMARIESTSGFIPLYRDEENMPSSHGVDEAEEKMARIESTSGFIPFYRAEENMPSSHIAHHESSYKSSHGVDEAEEKMARIESTSGFIPFYRAEENMPSSHIAHHKSSYKSSHGVDEAEEKMARIESTSGFIPFYRDEENMPSSHGVDEAKEKMARIESTSGFIPFYRDEENMPSSHIAHQKSSYKSSHGVDGAEEKMARIESTSGFIPFYRDEENMPSSHIAHHESSYKSSHYDDVGSEDVGLFTIDDVLSFHPGRKINTYFSIRKPDLYPGFLPREIADSIPFSSLEITKILQFFSVSPDSPKGKAIKNTLRKCDIKPAEGEMKICATSSESLVEFLKNAFGDVEIKLIGTTHPTMKTPILQSYKVLGAPKEIKSPNKVACHPLPYLYAIYMCHYDQISETKVFKVPLVGDNGDKVDALVVCHLDSSNFSHTHLAFSLLKVKPGTPLCHIFTEGHGVWVQSSTPTTSM